jgi:predicted nucleotidyltransferase
MTSSPSWSSIATRCARAACVMPPCSARSRGGGAADSDLDIMIELDPTAKIGVFQYVGIRRYIAELFATPVDVVDREGLKPHVRPSAEQDAIYAF